MSCQTCGAGLECPEGLDAPMQQAGFYVQVLAEAAREYSLYYCRNTLECPAGMLGTCAAGRHGIACSMCLDEHYRSDAGRCSPCGSADLLPFVILFVLFLSGIFVLVSFAKVDLTKRRLATATLLMVLGQAASLFQSMGIFAVLAVDWAEPVRSFFDFVAVFTFNLDIVKVSCFLGKDDPLLTFTLRLCVFPVFAVALAAAMLVMRRFGKERTLNEYFNANGLVLLMFFVSLTLIVFTPFECLPNPNGTSAMASNPGVLCWRGQHVGMVIFGILGILMYPIAISAVVGQATWRYPAAAAADNGISMLRSYAWLFGRFHPECYFFGAISLVRALLVALVPVLFPARHLEQVLILSVVLLLTVAVQCRLWPWRTLLANIADAAMGIGLVQLLLAGAFLVPEGGRYTSQQSSRTLTIFLTATFLAVMLASLLFIALAVMRRFWSGRIYGAFLCHHKSGGGAWARFVKCRLARFASWDVFLDSDNLEDLDTLFDLVRTASRNLVILSSKQTLFRMWCAGEIATASHNGVSMIVVASEESVIPDARFFDVPDNIWSAEERSTLITVGISMDMIKEAYAQLEAGRTVSFERFGDDASHDAVVQSLARLCDVQTGTSLDLVARKSSRPTVGILETEVVITGHPSNAEAISTIQFLRDLVQAKMMVPVSAVRLYESFLELGDTLKRMTAMVVLTEGILTDPEFANIMLFFQAKPPIRMVTILADTSFTFPGTAFLQQVASKGLNFDTLGPGGRRSQRLSHGPMVSKVSDKVWNESSSGNRRTVGPEDKDLKTVGPEDGPSLSRAYKRLLRILALPLTPCGSLGLLQRQVQEIARRAQSASSFDCDASELWEDVN